MNAIAFVSSISIILVGLFAWVLYIQIKNVNLVTGPIMGTDDNISVFNGTTGKIIKDGGVNVLAISEKKTLDFIHTPTPSNPIAGRSTVYVKDNNNMYILDTSGVEKRVIDVSTAPTAGQLLEASNTTAAAWTNPIVHRIPLAADSLSITNSNNYPSGATALSEGNLTFGENAGLSITDGAYNICIGNDSGSGMTTPLGNICVGDASGSLISIGGGNVTIGCFAGDTITTGNYNICIGESSDVSEDSDDKDNQIAIGYEVTTTVANECVIGNASLTHIRSMANCDLGTTDNKFKDLHISGAIQAGAVVVDISTAPTAGQLLEASSTTAAAWTNPIVHRIPLSANSLSITNSNNYPSGATAISNGNLTFGENAGLNITNGAFNICIGNGSGIDITGSAAGNICIGEESGYTITSSSGNIVIGCLAGESITTGDYNICIGDGSNSAPTLNNQIAIGKEVTTTVANECVIGNASLTHIRSMANCDLGTTGNKFKDLYLSGFIDVIQQKITIDSSSTHQTPTVAQLKPITVFDNNALINYTLPTMSVAEDGYKLTFINNSTGTKNIVRGGSDTIDGNVNFGLAQYDRVTLLYHDARWYSM